MENHNLQKPGPMRTTARPPEGSASLADRAEKAVEQAADSAINRVRSAQTGVSQQWTELAARILRVGALLREGSERMRKDDETTADYFRMAGERVDRIASYVNEADVATIAADAQEFVRKRPTVFVGGAFLFGLAAGRFFKASGEASAIAPSPAPSSQTDIVVSRGLSVGSPLGGTRMP